MNVNTFLRESTRAGFAMRFGLRTFPIVVNFIERGHHVNQDLRKFDVEN